MEEAGVPGENIYIEEKLKDIKWVIRSRTSKDRIQ
jgi:hypothetical protein